MTRETKVGLLIGMGVILLVGIILTDHLAVQSPDELLLTSHEYPETPADLPVIPPDESLIDDLPEEYPAPEPIAPEPQPPHVYRDPPEQVQAGDMAEVRWGPVPLDEVQKQAPPKPPTPTIGPAPRVHDVQRGESLYQIATRYWGDGNLYHALVAANEGRLLRGGHVREGVRLTIPPRPDRSAQERATPVDVSIAPRVSRVRHVKTIRVAEGDTLSSLTATHLGSASAWQNLLNANHKVIENENLLIPGMVLKLPEVGTGQTPPQPSMVAKDHFAARSYRTVAGDSLWMIASKMLGDPNRYPEIVSANRKLLSSARHLPVGVVIAIPPR